MKIKDICLFNNKNINKDFPNSHINYLDTSNLTRNIIGEIVPYDLNNSPSRAKRIVMENDTLISTVRPNQCHYGFIDSNRSNLIVSTGFLVITPNIRIVNAKYLYYFLTQENITNYLQTVALTATSSYPSITPDVIANIDISLPSMEQQNKIVDVLSKLDSKIELNNKLNKDLEELAQTLYAKWFINFDFPNEEGKPYKSSGGEMVESELGLIPKGWNVEVVQNLLSISYGKNLPKNKFKKNGFKVYGANGVVGFYDEFMFEDCTVICGCRGTVGNVYMTTKKSFITNNSLIFSSECLPNEFVYFGLKNLIPKVISGSVQKQITVESFNGLNFLLPENKVLNDFKLITNPLFEMINSNIKENDYLSKLRDTILPYLMNGTIKIK